jgi:hypothetical protein
MKNSMKPSKPANTQTKPAVENTSNAIDKVMSKLKKGKN